MSGQVQPVPDHLHTVTPRLVLKDATAAIRFYEAAFGAEVREEPFLGPNGEVVHAEVVIGDSVVYLTDEGDGAYGVAPGSAGGQVTSIMGLTVTDVDSWWDRALAAGCEVVYPLADQFYGERGGRVRDPFGHQWMLSMHIEDVSREELDRRMRAFSEEQG